MSVLNRVLFTSGQLLRRMGVDLHEASDPRVQEMQKTIRKLGSIQFQIDVLANGRWTAESTNIDGIITGGTDADDIHATIKDAVFTYFEIPPLLCNDTLMKGSQEPIRLEQRVYA